MPPHASSSTGGPPPKRPRQASHSPPSPPDANDGSDLNSASKDPSTAASSKVGGQSSTFRNVSACNRCRLRKNRCDQKLPSCASCAKAGVSCVGYDPITKKEIPRSYVYYLETRVKLLEDSLKANGLEFPPSDDLELCSRGVAATPKAASGEVAGGGAEGRPKEDRKKDADTAEGARDGDIKSATPSNTKPMLSTSGVSFARVVLAAVQHSRSDGHASGDKNTSRNPGGGSTSMRDSFFGLHTKPTIKPAPFPTKDVAMPLVTLYFEHANPQIPILHRQDFMRMFERSYAVGEASLGPRELYMLNMVFAIGSGVIMEETIKEEAAEDPRSALSQQHSQPEEYHASAIIHLESCLSNSGGGLEVLQAVLLLANMALLRPVPPGLWYIVGVAVRLAVDLGLHHEESAEDDEILTGPKDGQAKETRGRRSWLRDMKRRLWWCTYSFDRLVSMCVGRPFGISDQVITTQFPSAVSDEQITMNGLQDTLDPLPSYKHVAHHYFRLRLLQSEMMQVLQYNQAQIARANHPEPMYPEMHDNLPCPFLGPYRSFQEWRMHVDLRLEEWRDSAPSSSETGVAFSTEFLELNYWQAIVMLYRQSLSVPPMFRGEYNVANEVNSPTTHTAEAREDEEAIYDRVAEAGQKILKIYRHLQLSGLISHTYLTTHHLFLAGISFLYAIWHSPTVRGRLTMDEVDHSILSANSVFTALISKCPPAEPCRDAFDRTAKATIKMAKQTGGFGSGTHKRRPQRPRGLSYSTSTTSAARPQKQSHQQLDAIPDGFGVSPSGHLSSPGTSPLNKRRGHDTDSYSMQSPVGSITAPIDSGISPQMPPIDPSLANSPNRPRRVNSTTASSPTFMQQQHAASQQGQFVLQSPSEFPDMQFLQGFEGLTGDDQGQLHLGFGMDWEGGGYQDFDGGQMNPFDSFFFGGQQQPGGNGDGGGAGSGGGI